MRLSHPVERSLFCEQAIMNDEIWKDAPGWEGFYQVSDAGNVRSLDRTIKRLSKGGNLCESVIKGKLLRKRHHTGGYDYVSFCKNGKSQNKYVHRLVLEAFVGPCPENMECRHKNGVHKDNRLENLHWGIHIDNVWDRDRHGTLNRGEDIGTSKITEADVVEIRERYASRDWTQGELAEVYGLTQSGIGCIVRGVVWGRVGGPITKTGLGSYKRRPKK